MTGPADQPRPTAAVILADDPGGALRIAGLTLLDRLIVTAHRAGLSPIQVVGAGPLPLLRRTRALRIPFEHVTGRPAPAGAPVILLAAGLLIRVSDLQKLMRGEGRLVAADGTVLPAGRLPAGGALRLEELDRLQPLPAEGVSAWVRDDAGAREAAARLWASLTSSSDGTVDRHFNRPVGRWLSRVLVHTPVTPNQVSLASIGIGVVGAWFLAQGSHAAAVTGAVLFQISAIVDCVDGDIARMVFKESWLGKWLDIVGDQVVHAAVFIGVGVGAWRGGAGSTAGWLAASAVVGATIAFLVVLRGLLRPSLKPNARLQELIDRATNRDFSVVVLVLAIAGRLDWFLWMAGIGAHLFWMTALALQVGSGAGAGRGGDGGRPA